MKRKVIGVLAASRMSQIQQTLCVHKMREAGVDVTIVFTPYFSGSGGRPDFRVASMQSLERVLERFEPSCAVLCSKNSNLYSMMMGAAGGSLSDETLTVYGRNGEAEDAVRPEEFDLAGMMESSSFVGPLPAVVAALRRNSAEATGRKYVAHANIGAKLPPPSPPPPDPGGLPTLTVAFMTHNRTAVACHCLEALCRNLSYGGAIRFCICDDRSDPGHVEALEAVLARNGVSDYSVRRTTADRWGLGASMNNGLADAFSRSDIVLTTEDDFLLVRGFDITPHVNTVRCYDVAGVRLAHVGTRTGRGGTACSSVMASNRDEYWQVAGGNHRDPGEHYTFNNQVMLRHRRVFDFLGTYRENVRAETMEVDMCRRYSVMCRDGRGSSFRVLYPKSLPLDTLENGLFNHIGRSTMRHRHAVPGRYLGLNDEKRDADMRLEAMSAGPAAAAEAGHARPGKFRFHVITPFYNCSGLLDRCLRCVASQTIGKDRITMTVADDASDPDEATKARRMCAEYGFVEYERSDERVNTGGAKNIGIRKDVDCDYIVFLDADDVFCGDDCLERLDAELAEKGEPDVMLCGFLFGDSGKSRMFSASSPEEMAEASCIAPWIRVAKRDKTGLFNERRRIASDVTHYLRQLDSVSTVASSSFPLVKYTKDNRNSAWASKKVNFSNDVMAARFLLMHDLLGEKLKHQYARKAALRQMRYEYNVSLREVMAHIGEDTFKPDEPVQPSALPYAQVEKFKNDAVALLGRRFITDPQTIQEKFAYIKLFGVNGLMTRCADKLGVKEYAREVLGTDICVPTLAVYGSPDEMSFDRLPDKFVLKCNHGSEYNIIVTDKSAANEAVTRERLRRWLAVNYALVGGEFQYYSIERRAFAEKYVGDGTQTTDYKFVCFNGVPAYCQVIKYRHTPRQHLNWYDMDFRFVDISRTDYVARPDDLDERPASFDLMREYAAKLAKPFDFVRVDFFELDGRPYLGEMTFTPANARQKYRGDPETGLRLGSMLRITR